MKTHSPLEVHVTRGPRVESFHLVDAIVVDAKGQMKEIYGSADELVTYPRSSIKMLQAVSFVESGAYHTLALTPAHLALACASHYGEKIHTDLVMSWLDKIKLSENDLVCGAHNPYDEKTFEDLIRRGEKPCRRHNNCSGKHTGILATTVQLKWKPQGYQNYDHPLQQRWRKILSEMTGENLDKAEWGIDGCGIPTYASSLAGIARGFSQFLLDSSAQSADRKTSLQLIREAVMAEPYYISGHDGFCTDIIQETQGRAIVKTGAEGVYGGVLPEKGWAFALKVRDGQSRASEVATAHILQSLGGLTESEFLRLSHHTQPTIKNWEGQEVGKIFVGSRPIG